MRFLLSGLPAVLAIALAASAPVRAQRELSGAAEIRDSLGRAATLGSVLMIAAHPDDENTALLAYFARGRHLRTAYLSLTRGEGGQNLIGSEQGDLLGVIRTQELLSARRIDGAEQFFTRAIDFGFSKTVDETLAKWGRDKILSDIVWTIRSFRPDVIILRFTGTTRDGHGQHQASAILGREAFFAAADPARFPEQLKLVAPWRAKRLMHNLFSFSREQEQEASGLAGRIEIDTGEFDPVLGHSYNEIAGMSRSQHRTQGMGAPERRGPAKQYLITLAGEAARTDAIEGVDTTWRRVKDGGAGAEVARLLAEARQDFAPEHPERLVPQLLRAYKIAAGLERQQPELGQPVRVLAETIGLCAGLWMEAAAERYAAVPGSQVTVRATTLVRSPLAVQQTSLSVMGGRAKQTLGGPPATLAFNLPYTRSLVWDVPSSEPYSQPFWLAQPKQGDTYTIDAQPQVNLADSPSVLEARFDLSIEGEPVSFTRPVIYRYIERDRGELTRPFTVVPPVVVEMPERALVFGSASPRDVEIEVQANLAGASGSARLEVPQGWKVEPAAQAFSFTEAGEAKTLVYRVTPPAAAEASRGIGRALARLGAGDGGSGPEISAQMIQVRYPHIPPQAVFPPAASDFVRADIRLRAKSIGYVMGAGDDVPAALRQVGLEVTLLSPDDLARDELARFDAIVTGVRAYNTRADLRANQNRLLAYVESGGTLVVQYNVLEGGYMGGDPRLLLRIGPYPLTIGRDRVTEEDAPVRFPSPAHPVLHQPNEITAADFAGWVQERGLYFASGWDDRYQPLFETHDSNEPARAGGTLYARYGKGVYIFTALSWFRELPAGVPGAYRLFANFLSAGKAAAE